jgi:hypothetical protein
MERTLIDPLEQMRDFDFVMFEHDVLVGLGGLIKDVTSQLPQTVVGGLAASQTSTPSLSVNIGSGRIYQFAPSDAVAAGSIPQDLTNIVQQGYNAGQTLTFVPPSAGQSQWNLIQAQFSQTDAVRTNDPNGGIVPFYNPSNPTQPTNQSVNTVRQALCILQVVTGSAATTGSEVPPQPTSGWVPLYLIDLVGGQSTITTSQVLVTAPSIGTGVSSSYPYAPFLAGLLASHHSGTAGQAPKIKLASEVQGVLPYANMSSVRTLLNGALTIYVNNATGVDTNIGTSAGAPFKTIQAAINSVYRNYDFNGYGCTISVAAGAYSASVANGYVVAIGGVPVGMNTPISLVGNTASPGSVTITGVNSSGILCSLGSYVSISGFSISASGSSNGIVCTSASNVTVSSCIVGTCGSVQMLCTTGGSLTISTGITLTGSTIWSVLSAESGYIAAVGVTVTYSSLTVSGAGWAANQSGSVGSSGCTFTGTVTGSRYNAIMNGNITTGSAGSATYFPGTVAGTVANGGVYY